MYRPSILDRSGSLAGEGSTAAPTGASALESLSMLIYTRPFSPRPPNHVTLGCHAFAAAIERTGFLAILPRKHAARGTSLKRQRRRQLTSAGASGWWEKRHAT